MTTSRDPFASAVKKGRDAYHAGQSRRDNPYADHRKMDGRLTWSRAWQAAWDDGWVESWKEDGKHK